jgi:hypothetical protein
LAAAFGGFSTTAALAAPALGGIGAGSLDCPLPVGNPTHYNLEQGATVTCTIDNATEVTGSTTTPVWVKSSSLGNTQLTGSVSGSTITFTFTAPLNACNTSIVSYDAVGLNSNSMVISGKDAAAGLRFTLNGNPVTCGSQPPPPAIFLGYADSYRTGNSLPGIWQGSPNVVFVGCNFGVPDTCPQFKAGGDRYDAGAIRIDNTGTTDMTVTNASVQIGACHFAPWPGLNVSVPAGDSLILTQTGVTAAVCQPMAKKNYNFDTSDSYAGFTHSCTTNDGLIPKIDININGNALVLSDTGQVLNTGGTDPGFCQTNEMTPWTAIGTASPFQH